MGEGTEDTRKRVSQQRLVTTKYNRELIESVVKKLADEKLIVTQGQLDSNQPHDDRAEVEVAHEALIRNWLVLRQWLNENRDFLRQKTED